MERREPAVLLPVLRRATWGPFSHRKQNRYCGGEILANNKTKKRGLPQQIDLTTYIAGNLHFWINSLKRARPQDVVPFYHNIDGDLNPATEEVLNSYYTFSMP